MILSTSAVAVCCCSNSLQIVRAFVAPLEQPDILDRDDGLIGEGLEQLDLLVGERAHLLAEDGDDADQLCLHGAAGR